MAQSKASHIEYCEIVCVRNKKWFITKEGFIGQYGSCCPEKSLLANNRYSIRPRASLKKFGHERSEVMRIYQDFRHALV